jgi:NAD(P)-dependent dehydrogenase (short-subunit alcohol dehydrogenase family)
VGSSSGGGGAIGREICIHCAEEGAIVSLCDLDKAKGTRQENILPTCVCFGL